MPACVGILEVPEENWGMYGQQVHLAPMQVKAGSASDPAAHAAGRLQETIVEDSHLSILRRPPRSRAGIASHFKGEPRSQLATTALAPVRHPGRRRDVSSLSFSRDTALCADHRVAFLQI